ncbi:hypothetical protein NL676_036558 [Syzygium grande]|nr:hypothetical protein NL676_036558 [Syzygium grande]
MAGRESSEQGSHARASCFGILAISTRLLGVMNKEREEKHKWVSLVRGWRKGKPGGGQCQSGGGRAGDKTRPQQGNKKKQQECLLVREG